MSEEYKPSQGEIEKDKERMNLRGRTKLVSSSQRSDASRTCPWAQKITQVRDGFLCFENMEDYVDFQKDDPEIWDKSDDVFWGDENQTRWKNQLEKYGGRRE